MEEATNKFIKEEKKLDQFGSGKLSFIPSMRKSSLSTLLYIPEEKRASTGNTTNYLSLNKPNGTNRRSGKSGGGSFKKLSPTAQAAALVHARHFNTNILSHQQESGTFHHELTSPGPLHHDLLDTGALHGSMLTGMNNHNVEQQSNYNSNIGSLPPTSNTKIKSPLSAYSSNANMEISDENCDVNYRRQSVQAGAPIVAFRNNTGGGCGGTANARLANYGYCPALAARRIFERRSSQPTISLTTTGFRGRLTGSPNTNNPQITTNYYSPSKIYQKNEMVKSGTSLRLPMVQMIDNDLFLAQLPSTNVQNTVSSCNSTYNKIVKEGVLYKNNNTLAKRVSWLSMKSLQDGMEPFMELKLGRLVQNEGDAVNAGYGPLRSCDSKTNSQLGSTVFIDEVDLDVDTPPMDTMSWSNIDDFDNVTLMYSKHEKIPMKDFGSEIRATMDIDHLLNKAILLLDLQETSLEEIFAKIIHEMDIQEPEFTSEQVRSVLFTQDAGNQFHILSRTVQSICTTGTVGGSFDYDQTWICALCMLNTVQHRHVAIARLSHPTNLGRTMQDLRFIIIVIAPSRAKGTKTALETTRTFATLFADMDIRQRLVMANSVEVFRATLLGAAKELALEQSQWRERKASIHLSQAKEQVFGSGPWYPFRGLADDFFRRKRHYYSDYLDGLRGHRTMQKMFSSVIFLYFACLLPAIAFGVLNDDNTNGGINVRKVIFAQAIGGIFFAIFGGQPMIILLTTVPLAIYIKVIFRISESLGYDFFAMYTCVGLWCQFFLVIYASTELCNLMKLATRSAEEMFSLFIAIAFTVESIRAIHSSFVNNYNGCDENYVAIERKDPVRMVHALAQNYTLLERLINPELRHNITSAENSSFPCHRDTSILYLLLTCGTLWLALWLYNFRKTPYLTRSRREWLADYALPASVLIMSFAGAYCFSEIDKDMFKLRTEMRLFAIPEFWKLPWKAMIVCFLLGFFLSFLFYMDQNITSAIVNNSQNKLRKGSAQHLDLFVVAILNMFLSVMGLPWMHGALPHSPLHIRALADVEERLAQGHVHEVIMNVRETRLASLIAHILILASTFFLLPFPLQWIPTSVLHGLFLYMAFTSLTGNEMVERLLLLITEQQAYPPTHYIRRVPQRKVHLFTTCQLIQLVILCAVGFSPYPFVEMVFPIVCFCFLPIRHVLIPRLIDYKYLDALDGKH